MIEPGSNQHTDNTSAYLELLKKCLTRYLFQAKLDPFVPRRRASRFVFGNRLTRALLKYARLELARPVKFDADARRFGKDWPSDAETMIGLARLGNIQDCITDVIAQDVPGDVIETGVWRGGSAIFMRAVLKALGDTQRTVWLADSFQGLPRPNDIYPADARDRHWQFEELAVSVEQVKSNFEKYDLLDEKVHFLVGWFRDTLPAAPINELAVIRLDGDMYESTMDALRALYPKLSVGGYLIVDDYGCIPACKQAVEDYRQERQITETIEQIDWTGCFWKRLR